MRALLLALAISTTCAIASTDHDGNRNDESKSNNADISSNEYLMRKIKRLSEEARRQVKLRHKQAVTGCSDQQGLRFLQSGPPRALRVATYNLWNLNSKWDYRVNGMTSMIRYLSPDILAIQEVRWVPTKETIERDALKKKIDEAENSDETSEAEVDQDLEVEVEEDLEVVAEEDLEVEETIEYDEFGNDIKMFEENEPQLKKLAEATGYTHWAVRSAAAAARRSGSTWTPPDGFNEEGVAVMSKHPIVETTELALPPPDDCGDRNPRVVLAPLINVTAGRYSGLVRLLSAHLSYVKEEQCRTVPMLLEWADNLYSEDQEKYDQVVPQLLMGDLNFYFDFDWPADLLTQPSGHLSNSTLNPCAEHFLPYYKNKKSRQEAFVDAWEATRPGDSGYTFPVAEFQGKLPPARCDRILSRGFNSKISDLHGQCEAQEECAASNGIEPSRAAVLGCRPIDASGSLYMSDHFMVLADFAKQ